MNDTSVTLLNTGLPIALIGALAVILPWVLTPGATRSQRRVLVSVVLSALALAGASALVFAAFDKRSLLGGQGMAGQGMVAWLYLRSSLGAVLVWAPVLAFAWLGLAQRVERLKGEDMARGGG